jgi:hypothetical protein|tara:strand:+ start:51801 stop:52070 length:270 start_codon:yes stop_codon:yes gene_type:complete
MARTLCKGAEAALPTTTGAAVSFSQATVVRLVNTHTSAHLVTLVETRSGDVVGSFTMPAASVEYLEKQPTQCVFAANAGVKGAKVGFTA